MVILFQIKRTVLFSLILLTICSCEKPCTVYCLRESLPNYHDNSLECKLYFSGRKYWITLENTLDCVTTEKELTYGFFQRKKGKLILRDYNTGFETVLRRGSSLYVDCSFPFLEKKHFVFLEKQWDNNWGEMTAEICVQKEKIDEYSKIVSERKELRYGCYENDFADYIFKLIIEESGRYKLWLCNLLVSEGTWSREGNVLELLGNGFVEPFFMLIEDYKLIGSFVFPGYYAITEPSLFYNPVH